MYDDLKINLPKRMMEFKDFEFNEGLPDFIYGRDFCEY